MKIRVLIADDQPLMASALKTILSTQTDLEVVGLAQNGIEAVQIASRWKIDVAVLDIQMPQMNGLEAAKQILKEHKDTKVLMLTTFSDDNLVEDALEVGVHGFLLKDIDPENLISSVRRIYEGASVLSPDVTNFVFEEFRRRSNWKHKPTNDEIEIVNSLTEREKQVLGRVACAETNAEIAGALFIGTATVKTYVSRLINKLGVRDRVGLAVWAHKNHLTNPEESSQF